MIVPDVNLLLYAHITTFPQHERARRWWEGALNGADRVGLCAPVAFGFVRIATNPRIFAPPMSVDAAVAAVEGWRARPRVHWLHPGPRHVDLAFGLLAEAGTAANLCTDAQIAAFAIEHGATVYSNDTDFARFSGLKWINPLAARS